MEPNVPQNRAIELSPRPTASAHARDQYAADNAVALPEAGHLREAPQEVSEYLRLRPTAAVEHEPSAAASTAVHADAKIGPQR